MNLLMSSIIHSRERKKKKKLHTTTIRALPKFRCAFKRKITTLRSLEFVPLPSPWGDRYAKNFQSFPSLRIKPRGFANSRARARTNVSPQTLLLVLNSNEIVQLLNPACYFAPDNETEWKWRKKRAKSGILRFDHFQDFSKFFPRL